MAPAAHGAFGVESFDARVITQDDQLFQQAGGHPFEGYTEFALKTLPSGAPDGRVRNVRVDVPPGLISNPQALPYCTDPQLQSATCPPETQVGFVDVGTYLGLRVDLHLPLYNMTFGQDQVARFSFNPQQALLGEVGGVLGPVLNPLLKAAGVGSLDPVHVIGGIRDTSDYGLLFTISDIPQKPEIVYSKLTFWGVPADDAHNAERGNVCVDTALLPAVCFGGGQISDHGSFPFLTNPTKCGGPGPTTHLTLTSHAGEQATEQSTLPDSAHNCHLVPFDPAITFGPQAMSRDAPTSFDFHLHVPQTQFGDVLGTAHVEDVAVTLPPGLTISPSAANGLEACTDEQFGQGTHNPIACSAASRLGDVSIVTPLLPDPLVGGAYLGQPLPGDRYRLFLVADGHGVTVRLKGSVRPDPATGQLTAVFEDNPQVPFTSLSVNLRGGPRAPLAAPLGCGAATGASRIAPYTGQPPATPDAAVEVSGCGGSPFAPTLGARNGSSAAGAFAPFTLTLGRDDGNEFLSGVSVDLPPGLLGMISTVERCADAAAAAGACPAASRVGTASVLAGPGPEPFALSGPVYLTGPYRGAPFGLAVVIRAIAGPFDLGTVVVRQAIHVDPNDAHLTVASDPLPQILEGVPLRLRSATVDIDRSGFMRNPTSCGAKQVSAALASAAGTPANRSAGLAFDRCEALPFDPTLSLRLTGRKQTAKRKHPGLRARLTQKASEAAIRSARVVLPKSLALDPGNARQICGFDAGQRAQCPDKSVIGQASAVTPVLNRPLRGPVYLVQGIRTDPKTGRQIRTLPTLLATLRGEVAINLRGNTAVERGRLVNTFPAVPDAPITRFELRVEGGRHGILVTNRRICGRRQTAKATLDGHNGKRSERNLRVQTPCAAKKQRTACRTKKQKRTKACKRRAARPRAGRGSR